MNIRLYNLTKPTIIFICSELTDFTGAYLHVFKEFGCTLCIKTKLNLADYLDVKFNLIKGIISLYRNYKNTSCSINTASNHLPTVLNELHKSICKRLLTWIIKKFSTGQKLNRKNHLWMGVKAIIYIWNSLFSQGKFHNCFL